MQRQNQLYSLSSASRSALSADSVKSFMSNFDCVKVILSEDLLSDSDNCIADLFNFLGVDSDFKPNMDEKHNVALAPKDNYFAHILYRKNIFKDISTSILPDFIIEKLKRFRNTYFMTRGKKAMKAETKKLLKDIFRNDILKTQDLLSRNLSSWI